MEKLITAQDVSRILGVSVKTVDRFRNLKTNRLRSFRSNSTVRFDLKDVEDFIKRNKS